MAALFAVLRSQSNSQLTDARKDLADARKETSDARAELATERSARLTYVERKLEESEDREAQAAAMIANIADLARAQTRGGITDAPPADRQSEPMPPLPPPGRPPFRSRPR